MSPIIRALSLSWWTKVEAEPPAPMMGVGRGDAQPAPSLYEFLKNRVPAARKARVGRADPVARSEERICHTLLGAYVDERTTLAAVHRYTADNDEFVRTAARNLWYGWHASQGVLARWE